MKKLFIGVVAMAATLFVGCGQSFYPTDNHNLVATNVNISEANFRVVGLVEGKAKATYILGIGGLSGKALRANAYSDMVRNANLKGSQMVVNATISQTHYGFVPFRWTQMVKYQGTIIEFISSHQPSIAEVCEESKIQPTVSSVKNSRLAPSTKKEVKKSAKVADKKPTDKKVVKEYIETSVKEDVAKEIDSMSKSKRNRYLTDIISRLDRLCSRPKLIQENGDKIEDLMARLKYILDNYDCGTSPHKSYKKFMDKLSE